LIEPNNLDSQGKETRVKICALTNLEDALSAARAGADYLGFVFYPKSKRFIHTDKVRHISHEVQSLEHPPILVGVFVDDSPERMAEVLEYCALDLAQMHGDEPPSYIGDPASPLYGRSYKALKPSSLSVANVEVEWYIPPIKSNNSPSLLIDSYHPSMPGGTGLVADWDIARQLAADIPGLMLAGGLNPMNVSGAIEEVRPYAVDVSSGVERKPGKKDPALVKAFIRAAKNRLT